ncbi:MAG: hypothetical protein SAqTSA_28630 [Shewanella algae]
MTLTEYLKLWASQGIMLRLAPNGILLGWIEITAHQQHRRLLKPLHACSRLSRWPRLKRKQRLLYLF